MSLNKLLSVGRSFAGMRDRKTPFEMRKECLLPIFEPAPRFLARQEPAPEPETNGPTQTDWLKTEGEIPRAASEIKVAPKETTVSRDLHAAKEESKTAAQKRSLWSRLTFGIFDRKPPTPSLGAALVQSELSLDRVRPLRNDLHDSDLELVLKKRPQARKASAAASSSPAPENEGRLRLAGRMFEASGAKTP